MNSVVPSPCETQSYNKPLYFSNHFMQDDFLLGPQATDLINKLTSVSYASFLLVIMNSLITLLKKLRIIHFVKVFISQIIPSNHQ